MTPTDPAMAATDPYVPTAQAAQLTGVPVRTIRRWAKSGHVPAMTGPHKLLVNLAAVQRLAATSGHTEPVARPVAANDPKVAPDGPVMAQDGPATGITDLVRLVEKQQRDLIELSGRVGWLMSELEQARATIRLLQPPPATSNHPSEGENGPRIDVQTAGSVPNGAERPPEASTSRAPGETTNHAGDHAITAQRTWWRRLGRWIAQPG